MSLRQSPTRTPGFLAANHRNAQKCTGPRTVAGKARSSLNALKHGGYAQGLAAQLLAAGDRASAAFYTRICGEIAFAFRVSTAAGAAQAEKLANTVFAMARGAGVLGTKPECPLFSARFGPRSTSYSRFAIHDLPKRIGLVYWVQRRGYWTRERVFRALLSTAPSEEPPLSRTLEHRLRRRIFRLRRPSILEWAKF